MIAWRDACLSLDAVRNSADDRETLIKVYAEYAWGFDNGEIPPGREASSFDVEDSPSETRPLPARGLRAGREG